MAEQVETLIVGGGQAGIAMSEHLGKSGCEHLILERSRVVESWRSARWDSLVANGPAWHDRFPGMEFKDIHPDAFATKSAVVSYFEDYVKMINSPVRCGVEVQKVTRAAGRAGFNVSTSHGEFKSNNIVAATGAFQTPVIPPVVPAKRENLKQIHSCDYRNPEQLPDGAVLVVGAGSSGSQIAEELMNAGRQVYLSVGPHDRPPRRYRDRDLVWWLGVLGIWDIDKPREDSDHVTIAVSGANGGHTVDFRRFANNGMTLLGMTTGFEQGVLYFSDDLARNVTRGDENYLALLDAADRFIADNGLKLPEEPSARDIPPVPACMVDPLNSLHLSDNNVTCIIWATGYAVDYNWLKVGALDAHGKPLHSRGISSAPGVYFLGLPCQVNRGSSFIWGAWQDARIIADHIVKQKSYHSYCRQSYRFSEQTG
ncbi:MAG: flavin-containing monooxygenase [Granulosicoccus sp.]